MKIDMNDFLNSSFDCDTCVNYKNPPGSDGMPDESRSSMMTGHVLCVDVDMCSPTVASERSDFDNLDFDMSNILCGCTATLTGPTTSDEEENCTEEMALGIVSMPSSAQTIPAVSLSASFGKYND